MKIEKVSNESKRKFSNAKDYYYVIKDIEDSDGKNINLLFTKRELLVAIDKFNKFFSGK